MHMFSVFTCEAGTEWDVLVDSKSFEFFIIFAFRALWTSGLIPTPFLSGNFCNILLICLPPIVILLKQLSFEFRFKCAFSFSIVDLEATLGMSLSIEFRYLFMSSTSKFAKSDKKLSEKPEPVSDVLVVILQLFSTVTVWSVQSWSVMHKLSGVLTQLSVPVLTFSIPVIVRGFLIVGVACVVSVVSELGSHIAGPVHGGPTEIHGLGSCVWICWSPCFIVGSPCP